MHTEVKCRLQGIVFLTEWCFCFHLWNLTVNRVTGALFRLTWVISRLTGVILSLTRAWFRLTGVHSFTTFSLNNDLLYSSVSQGLGTTKFTNLIGWNGYWPRSRFSHLDRHLDRQCFEVKKSQTKMQHHWLFSSNNIYFCKCQKADEKKKIKRTSLYLRPRSRFSHTDLLPG